jgi:CheY-like chemotaxis protein
LGCRVLAKLGYRVLAARSGAEAIDLSGAETGPIQLLLTDVVMPGMSGRELANRLAPTRSAMKILYASGYTENVIAHHGVLDHGILFLSKPYTPRTLAVAVRAALDS